MCFRRESVNVMGSGICVKCKNCNKKFEFLDGTGKLDYEPNLMNYDSDFNLLRRYKNGIGKWELRRILKNKRHILDDKYYGYKTYQCPTCKRITNEFYFKLIALRKDESDFVSEYKCYKCKTKMNALDNIEKCPLCGGEFDKESMEIIRWD